jgi:hypothetical protein
MDWPVLSPHLRRFKLEKIGFSSLAAERQKSPALMPATASYMQTEFDLARSLKIYRNIFSLLVSK